MTYPRVLFKHDFFPNNHSAIFRFFRLVFCLLFLFPSCASYKVPTESFPRQETLAHPLYQFVPRHRCQIRAFDLPHWGAWMFFGNDDDGIFGEASRRAYRIQQRNTLGKAFSWWCRNPLHNFTHYVIGSAHRVNSELTLLNINCRGIDCFEYDSMAKKNYGCKCTSLFLALHGGKPFISLRIKYPWNRYTHFYLGWRKNGCFGIKFQPMSKK